MSRPVYARRIAAIVLLLLLIWASRQINITAFPPFLDEGVFLRFAEDQAAISPLSHAQEGRLFNLWLYSLFSSYTGGTFWLARTVTLLLLLPGFAAVIGAARQAAGWTGAALTGLLLLFSPYHQFFDRLAMADSLAAGGAILAVYFAYRLKQRVYLWDAALCGGALFLALGFKVTALPYYGIPLAAALTLGRQFHWRARLRWLGVALGVCLVLTAALALGLRTFEYDYFFLFQHHNAASSTGLGERLLSNALIMLDTARGFLGLPVVILAGLATLSLIWRREYFLPLVLLAPALALSASAKQSTRFYETPMTLLLLSVAIGLAHVTEKRSFAFRLGVLAGVLAWGLTLWLPFTLTVNADPANLTLFALTYNEYAASDASGFGLEEVREQLLEAEAETVYGLLANCQGLRYTSLPDYTVECPRVNPNGDDIPALAALLGENRRPGAYAVLEDSPYVPETAPGTLLAIIEDPSGRPALAVYDLAP